MKLITCAAIAAATYVGVSASASAVTIDFDSLAPGTTVTTIEGVTFSSNIGCCDLIVSTGLETTSGANYLGIDDGGTESFLGGDEITFDFDQAVLSLTLSVVAVFGLPDATFTLSGGGMSDISGAPDLTLLSGDEVYILTIANPAGFTTATLSAALGLAAFNIDDIVFTPVPLPGALFLFLTGLCGVFGRRLFKARSV